MSANGTRKSSAFIGTNGKSIRVVFARPFETEERFFYQRKVNQALGKPIKSMNAISSWDEIPLFDSEEAEAAFWAHNRIELRLMEATVAASLEISESVTITLPDRSPNAGEDQTARPPALPELPKHDQTMVE